MGEVKTKYKKCDDCDVILAYTFKKKSKCLSCRKIYRNYRRKEYDKKYLENNRERIKEFKCNYYLNNKDLIIFRQKNNPNTKTTQRKTYQKNKYKIIEKQKIYRAKNKDKHNITAKLYRDKNKEKLKNYYNKWRTENKHIIKANCKKHKLSRLNRIPKWTNLKKIKEIYKNCPENYHVDHIIPLKGKTVSGLHIPSNLQYLSAKDNLTKKNSFKEEYLLINGLG